MTVETAVWWPKPGAVYLTDADDRIVVRDVGDDWAVVRIILSRGGSWVERVALRDGRFPWPTCAAGPLATARAVKSDRLISRWEVADRRGDVDG
jgi:hypothetical protein